MKVTKLRTNDISLIEIDPTKKYILITDIAIFDQPTRTKREIEETHKNIKVVYSESYEDIQIVEQEK